ncbi:hypothetical protein L1887_47866 [Cichorium endivia]|nr:hypothetical protein L1887_47866 [Cichorium endivia]
MVGVYGGVTWEEHDVRLRGQSAARLRELRRRWAQGRACCDIHAGRAAAAAASKAAQCDWSARVWDGMKKSRKRIFKAHEAPPYAAEGLEGRLCVRFSAPSNVVGRVAAALAYGAFTSTASASTLASVLSQ